MKVLVIGPSDKNARGGIATVISNIRNSKLLNEEFELSIFSSYIDGNLIVRFFYNVIAILKFLIIFRKYDLFHIHTASYSSAYRKSIYLKIIKYAEKKAIVHVHSGKFMNFFDGLNGKGRNWILNFLKSADLVIALSENWKEQFEKKFALSNCVSIENGVDIKLFESAIQNPDKCKHNFLFLSKLTRDKGVYDLIDAVEKIIKEKPDIKVYMAGDGEIEKVHEQVKIRNLSNNIEVVGWVDTQGKIELLKKCAVVVLPSYYEGLPMAILEGMAAGKIIISTTVGAIPEVVKSENGFLITPGDINALVFNMKKCAEGGEFLNDISENNIKKIAAEFSIEKKLSQLAAYYNQIAAK